MNRVRSIWGIRLVAGLLMASLLPVTFATAVHAAQHTSSYADWVRLQLRIPAGEAVEQALETATESRARSLEAFLIVFVEAYEAQQPERSLALAFSTHDLSNDALISYLEGHYLGFVGDAVLPRAALVAAKVASKQVLERGPISLVTLTRIDLSRRAWAATLQPSHAPVFILSLRTLSAAQPLGP